jgi:hypothetical protein
VLDYRLGDGEDSVRGRAQMQEYCAAMQRSFGRALLFTDGALSEDEAT